MSGLGLLGGGSGVVGEVGILRIVFVYLQGSDAVGQLHKFNTATKPCFGNVCLDLGQQVVVGSGLAAEPLVLKRLLSQKLEVVHVPAYSR